MPGSQSVSLPTVAELVNELDGDSVEDAGLLYDEDGHLIDADTGELVAVNLNVLLADDDGSDADQDQDRDQEVEELRGENARLRSLLEAQGAPVTAGGAGAGVYAGSTVVVDGQRRVVHRVHGHGVVTLVDEEKPKRRYLPDEYEAVS